MGQKIIPISLRLQKKKIGIQNGLLIITNILIYYILI